MSHRLSKTEKNCWGRHCYQGGGPFDRGSQTHVGTTDIPPPVKNNMDRMNQLVGRHSYQGESLCEGGSRRHVGTTDLSPPVKNQHRHNEPAGQVDILSRVEVHVMSHCLSKTTQTESTSWSGRHSYQGRGLCDRGSGTSVVQGFYPSCCTRRIRWSCEVLTSVHNDYTGWSL